MRVVMVACLGISVKVAKKREANEDAQMQEDSGTMKVFCRILLTQVIFCTHASQDARLRWIPSFLFAIAGMLSACTSSCVLIFLVDSAGVSTWTAYQSTLASPAALQAFQQFQAASRA